MVIINLKLNPPIERALKMLLFTGFRGYLVGGCVRDLLLKRKPTDIDICTNALPQNILQTFVLFETKQKGIAHGTITVILYSVPVEITTYRVDGTYSDGRHPDKVTFTDQLHVDLARRDFTINAMAYNQAVGLIDYHHGWEDLNKKLIRCVGNPSVRLVEDSLRIMRALRFASVLNFRIETKTKKAIFEHKQLLEKIPTAVLSKELVKLLKGPNCRKVLEEYTTVIMVFIPELCILNPEEIKGMAWSVSKLPNSHRLRLAAFLYMLEDKDVRAVLTRLSIKKKVMDEICLLIEHAKKNIKPDGKTVRNYIRNYNIEILEQVLILKKACLAYKKCSNRCEYTIDEKNINVAMQMVKKIIKNNGCCNLQGLRINGDDLLKLNIPKSPQIGYILEKLLDLVIEGKLKNNKEALITYVKKFF